MRRKIATRDSWKTVPLSKSRRVQLPIEVWLSKSEFNRLKRGNIPQEMEDKWFIFHDDGWVYFHRSWTGYCIYQLRFALEGKEFVCCEAWVTRDPEQYKNKSTKHDQHTLHSLLYLRFAIGTKPSRE